MRSLRLSRKQLRGEHGEEPEPLGKLRRRCIGGAIGASSAYLAVITTTVVRPSAMSDPLTIGLLIGFGTPAALCGLGAVLTWAVLQMPSALALQEIDFARQSEDLKWAIRFGEDMADAFHGAPTRSSRGR